MAWADEKVDSVSDRTTVKWQDYAIYLVVSVGLVLFLTLLLHHGLPDYREVTNDGKWYLTNAGLDYWGIGVSKPNYRYRTLIGDIVRRLPVRVDVGFALVSLSATALYLAALAGWVRTAGLSTLAALAGLLILGTQFYPTVYFVQNPFLVDSVLHLLWVAGIIAMFYGFDLWFGLIVLVGILNHEAMFFLLIPFWLVQLMRTSFIKATTTMVAIGSAAFVTYLVHTSSLTLPQATQGPGGVRWLVGSALGNILGESAWVRLRHGLSGLLLGGGLLYPLWARSALRSRSDTPWLALKPISLGVLLFVLISLPGAVGTGRVLNYLVPVWLPWFLLTLSRLSKRRMCTVVALVLIGNVLLSAATVLTLRGEMILRVIGLLFVGLGVFICWRTEPMRDCLPRTI